MTEIQNQKTIDIEDTSSPYYELLKQIDGYPNLDSWWSEKVVRPVLLRFAPQFFAMIGLEIFVLCLHNWVAAFILVGFIALRIYGTLTSLSISMLHAFLVTQIRDSFARGIAIGESRTQQ